MFAPLFGAQTKAEIPPANPVIAAPTEAAQDYRTPEGMPSPQPADTITIRKPDGSVDHMATYTRFSDKFRGSTSPAEMVALVKEIMSVFSPDLILHNDPSQQKKYTARDILGGLESVLSGSPYDRLPTNLNFGAVDRLPMLFRQQVMAALSQERSSAVKSTEGDLDNQATLDRFRQKLQEATSVESMKTAIMELQTVFPKLVLHNEQVPGQPNKQYTAQEILARLEALAQGAGDETIPKKLNLGYLPEGEVIPLRELVRKTVFKEIVRAVQKVENHPSQPWDIKMQKVVEEFDTQTGVKYGGVRLKPTVTWPDSSTNVLDFMSLTKIITDLKTYLNNYKTRQVNNVPITYIISSDTEKMVLFKRSVA